MRNAKLENYLNGVPMRYADFRISGFYIAFAVSRAKLFRLAFGLFCSPIALTWDFNDCKAGSGEKTIEKLISFLFFFD